ncbi:MmgE/PrpD family protein [Georgenia sp. 10Sc9-8]|uniref:MmgE/PrpD family protein n=1 Tax=Georgenia halotolerans TaxID=3028317 RepID=A0ABT5U272_9MICO|nr:MmgE/PrpD family protein [Georgenia halotolerans]
MDRTLQSIVEFSTMTRADEIPAEVLTQATAILTDSLACAVGGRDCMGAEVAKRFPAQPTGLGGAVIGTGTPYTPDIAAFWNTSMIRYLDYNDTFTGGHPSDMIGALVATSLKYSGVDVLRAIVVAYEVFHRVQKRMRAFGSDSEARVNYLSTDQGFAVAIGATAGMCNLFGFDRDTTRHAVSLAATHGLPLRASRAGELSHYKGVATAVSARHAVFCCHMAESGLTAPDAPFEGRHGLMEVMAGAAQPAELDAFGDWAILRSGLKYFPVTANCQIAAWAALDLRKLIAPSEVESVTLRTSRFLKHESGSEPAKWSPRTRETADHSLPFVFSTSLRDGDISMESFEPGKLHDPELASLMDKISIEVDEEIESEWPDVIQIRVEADTANGARHVVHLRDPKGTYRNPMTRSDIQRKYVALVGPALGEPQAIESFEAAWETSRAPSFATVLETLALTRPDAPAEQRASYPAE